MLKKVGKVKIEDIGSKSKKFGEFLFLQSGNEAMDVAKIVEYIALQEECVSIGACKNTGLIFCNTGRI